MANKTITRRGFLTQTTAGAGALLLEPAEQKSEMAPSKEPKRINRRSYEEIVRLPVFKTNIEPHWFAGDEKFWYRNDGIGGTREFILVDAAQGVRSPAFDHARLATSLGKAAGKTFAPDILPFESIRFTDSEKTIRFRIDEQEWECDLASYVCIQQTVAPKGNDTDSSKKTDDANSRREARMISSDKRWKIIRRDNDVWVRDEQAATEKRLTKDGSEEYSYGGFEWSPDSRRFAGFRIRNVTIKPAYVIESSPKDGSMRGALHSHEYAQPGDPFPVHEPWVFDPAAGTATKLTAEPVDFGEYPPDVVWRPDGSGFLYEKTDRGHQRFRLFTVDIEANKSSVVIDEQSKTFINTSNAYTYYTKNTAEIIYASEKDGWRHLYLYDAEKGILKNRITSGEWVLRGVDRVDENTRQIWFHGSGRNPTENPYHLHYYRVNFDGTGLVALTDGNGTHSVDYSPNSKYLIDTYSRADLPPVHTLRSTTDGRLICDLEKADISAITKAGWRMPEVFHAKGRDKRTDIWGVVFRPLNFDPKKQYPVIENIYAGPHDSFVRHHFSVRDGMQSLAELGFIVVQCDGMGTRNRSKAFHDVCWRNVKDAGLPDRIAWIKALAARYPYVDAKRVGIYGTSAGGQSSTGALLFHPEFYKVAVSSCGCHDNRVDKRWWNEQWMGYPVGDWYTDNSNITHAEKLRGKLLLMVGELDTNVPPESTIRLADALMTADKDFELLVLPGAGHTGGGKYGERRRRDFFIRHLIGVEPPDRNLPKPVPVPTLLKPRPLGEANLAGGDGGENTSIQIRNLTAGEIQLFWLPGGGKRTQYGTVAAGATRTLNTYSNHYWLITDKQGKPLALYVGESYPGIAEIRP